MTRDSFSSSIYLKIHLIAEYLLLQKSWWQKRIRTFCKVENVEKSLNREGLKFINRYQFRELFQFTPQNNKRNVWVLYSIHILFMIYIMIIKAFVLFIN